uniref:Uncharacterized protein n=1 Tax=Arundo donax TaxID=35708 RepID=A0A0A9HX03_ARUDO
MVLRAIWLPALVANSNRSRFADKPNTEYNFVFLALLI